MNRPATTEYGRRLDVQQRHRPGAELHVFPASVAGSHVPFLENPGPFNAVVDTFLS
ncbi:alpha/beta fold hydrolase [Kitasatospora sp. NPDC057500]|uniref:alpha/beta fold hydrolase n=1 Tax=Kitasatospora sp. NPDC057500 TaxID=3346151 RepID=UPI0036BA7C13